MPFRCVPTAGAVRTNLAITELDGTTTKLNEPGAALDAAALDALTRSVVDARRTRRLGGAVRLAAAGRARRAGTPTSSRCSRSIRAGSRSTPPMRPLAALVASFDRAAPDLIKPNAEELAGVLGYSPQALEAAVAQGDPEPVVAAARRLVDRGVRRGARHPRRRRRGAGRRDRELDGHPAAHRPAQHRRRRRRLTRRLRPRRRRRRRPAAAAADGRRLRQRRRRAARLRAPDARADRPQCRSGDTDPPPISPTTNTKVSP